MHRVRMTVHQVYVPAATSWFCTRFKNIPRAATSRHLNLETCSCHGQIIPSAHGHTPGEWSCCVKHGRLRQLGRSHAPCVHYFVVCSALGFRSVSLSVRIHFCRTFLTTTKIIDFPLVIFRKAGQRYPCERWDASVPTRTAVHHVGCSRSWDSLVYPWRISFASTSILRLLAWSTTQLSTK